LGKNNSSVNIRSVAKTLNIRNFSQNIRSDVKTSEVTILVATASQTPRRYVLQLSVETLHPLWLAVKYCTTLPVISFSLFL